MSESPSVASNGRGRNGTFAKGHKFAKGNPHAAKAQKLRNALFQTVSVAKLRRVLNRLIEKAIEGDVSAIKLLLDRLLGRPLAADVEERLQALEERLKHDD
jgi:hypothetical protein